MPIVAAGVRSLLVPRRFRRTTAEEKKAFITTVSKVAYVNDEGGVKIAKLKEGTLAEYDLDDPNEPRR